MLMSVPSTLMAVLTTVSTPLDPTHVVVDLDTHWLPTDTLVKVLYYVLLILHAHSKYYACMHALPNTIVIVTGFGKTLRKGSTCDSHNACL